jgi:hypothetical protein
MVASVSRAARMIRSHSHNAVFMDEMLQIVFRSHKNSEPVQLAAAIARREGSLFDDIVTL